jgi:hypothetical protein
MVRTQIYLTEAERQALGKLSAQTGKPQSELIREALDGYLHQHAGERRRLALARAVGLWRDRRDLPDFAQLRQSWER